ncbi:YppG family protein [Anaerobacillus sp. CMMVII]|uniref:YppG family protein n=1 Tax=Anaerobacillus sp. CMMVII TaxID=2755588 RepID=UPI0028E0A02C|nr:YppG family protein [Anaerobacillus sp. CMMVII]
MNQPMYQQYQIPQQGYPERRGFLGGPRQMNFQGQHPSIPPNYYRQQQQAFFPQQHPIPNPQQKLSMFRNDQGQLDFQKIGGGVQTVMGLVNQVSPMVKMVSGFFK